MTRVYAVVYGNYFPREIDSLWELHFDAARRISYLNQRSAIEADWQIATMTIHPVGFAPENVDVAETET